MSYKFEYYPDPGIAYDIVKMLFLKLTSPNEWKEMLTTITSHEYYTEYIQNKANLLPDPTPELLLYVYIPINKKYTFLSTIIAKLIDTDVHSFTLNSLITYLSNVDEVKEDLYSYYLGTQDYSNTDLDHLIRTNKNIPDKIKVLLFGFAMYSYKHISYLIKTIEEYYIIIKENWISDIPTEFDLNLFLEKVIDEIYSSNTMLLNSLKNNSIPYSLCHSTPDFLSLGFSSSYPYFISTYDSIQSMIKNDSKPSTSEIILAARALSDNYRISILNQLSCHTSLTFAEIALQSNLSETTIKYHLSILKKANLINTTRHNRQIHYSSNPLGFRYIKKAFELLEKGEMLK